MVDRSGTADRDADSPHKRLMHAFEMLYTARWNVPKAASYAGISPLNMKMRFSIWMGITNHAPAYQQLELFL